MLRESRTEQRERRTTPNKLVSILLCKHRSINGTDLWYFVKTQLDDLGILGYVLSKRSEKARCCDDAGAKATLGAILYRSEGHEGEPILPSAMVLWRR